MTKSITELPEWQALKAHQQQVALQRMQDWFAADPLRFQQFSLQVGDILLDYSKNRITAQTVGLLCQLAEATDLSAKIEALFSGQPVNTTEKRAALHTSLRDTSAEDFYINGKNITVDINSALANMEQFTQQVRRGAWLGATGKPIRDIINIGIGGSHLGPLLTTHALTDFADTKLACHFISNIDAAHLHEVLREIDLETSLFIVSSKSFTTLETITNANTLKHLLQQALGTDAVKKHFVAVTACVDKAVAFGILPTNIFPIWDWIGGRYSIWSAIGLPLSLMIGMENFLAFLKGANAMDQHFRQTEFSQNMPVIMALCGIWYINFFGANNHAIVPYSHQLTHLRTYLQQADMESNGKSISHSGLPIDYATGPIIWGEQGCNAQHAFHQLLHQGQHLIAVDFIVTGSEKNIYEHHHDILIASALSQAQALMQGKSGEQAYTEAITSGNNQKTATMLAAHKTIPGNKPSNILFLDKVTPHSLGMLLALYEHKIYVQGAIWEINSFDQWGVELGKQLLPKILSNVKQSDTETTLDSSTLGLIQHYRKLRTLA
jgi:glucose-6-phosphate isomerase